jgi:nucleotidyltransferase/DNA polymerase involved in DNA repair
MGAPYFKQKDIFRRHGIVTFSSNYELYADMSHRVMTTLEELTPRVEIYSIDEAFAISPGSAIVLTSRPLAVKSARRCCNVRT